MSILDKYNQGNGGNYEYDTPETHEYKNLRDLYSKDIDNTFKLNAMFINTKSKFGDAPVFVTDNEMVNIPQHLTDTVKEMNQDTELVNEVNIGNIGFEIYEYESKKYGTQHSINFVEM